MERVNQTNSVSQFILLGLTSRAEDQRPLFILFLTIYLITILEKLLIILAIRFDNFLSERKVISYAGCLTQMYFIHALGNSDSFLLAVMAFDRYVAICHPFDYITTMSQCCCALLAVFSCTFPHLHSLLHTLLLNLLIFCDSNVIHHFLCDISPLMKLSCSPTFVNEIVMITEGAVVLETPFLCITLSYIQILITVLKIPSASGKHKAFSTCGVHLIVVVLFYGSIFYVYLHPVSTYTVKDHIAIVVYTVLSSTLRNKDLKQCLGKLMNR
uniref:G-protein coupled receptors family 1 profile domain-containing protein n=1 Tax=Cavia porcellus TaxID=10141 RepID=A0A286Y1M3_CAVPO